MKTGFNHNLQTGFFKQEKIHLKYVPKTRHFYEQIPKPDIYEQKLQFEIEKIKNRWDFIFTDWKENKWMGFYLYRLKKKQIQ